METVSSTASTNQGTAAVTKYDFNEMRRQITDLKASDESVIGYLEKVLSDEKASPESRQMAVRFFQERQERETLLSQLVRAVGDTAQRIIGNVR